jgi:putative two-component system response regulator
MKDHQQPGVILVVDDAPASLKLLNHLLTQSGYQVREATDGDAALKSASQSPPDLILLDVSMPGMNGYETCRRLKEQPQLKGVPVIFLSALGEALDKVKAFGSGGVDYVTKPFEFAEMQARIETHLKLQRLQRELQEYNLRLQELVKEQVQEISDSQMAAIFALMRLAESRDSDTGQHLDRVRMYCRALAEKLRGNPEFQGLIDPAYIENIYHASPLHDIGKVGVPDAILLKPGKLTSEEFEVMKAHTTIGARTLEAVHRQYPANAFLARGIEIARSHHERWDGSGYPDGLVGDQAPLSARIMAVADVYDALRTTRRYKSALSHEESLRAIVEARGKQFDPRVVEALVAVADQFNSIHASMSDG